MRYIVTNSPDSTDTPVRLNADGTCQIRDVSLRVVAGNRPGLYHVSLNDTEPVPIMLTSDGIDFVSISIRGYTYDVKVLKEGHHRLFAMLNASPAAQHRTIKVTAPMPGLLKTVFFAEHAHVRKGDTLFILEAMKMENAIASPVSGILHSVALSEGLPVEKGSVLCIVEPT
ncbi:MAG: acetyl-CoA carboxylase biotin carboxyl carrier protein subunit [bacterium]|nr:acetyl-CoA carboxylase biotin carboxyl carrier protein subunit [bacterium]